MGNPSDRRSAKYRRIVFEETSISLASSLTESPLVDCESLITCMPMVLGRRLPESIRTSLVARVRDHLTPCGLATEKVSSSQYMECGYWRGPIWAPSTMLVVHGLADIGEDELAKTIARAFCKMCVDNGFFENFDAKTGAGHFDSAYTWTSSVFMILAGQYC